MVEVKLDQHFLEDKELLDKIVNLSDIKESDIVFEIGPGKGDLTKAILKKNPSKLIAIEKDVALKDYLSLELVENSNLEIIYGDGILELDNHLITKLIANIPYSITEPLYTKILDLKLPFCVLLHGIDFYKNIIERDTKWKYFVPAFYDLELLEEVEGSKFNPKTKVKSVFIKLKLKNDNDLLNDNNFFQYLWNKRSRNTKNALIYTFVDTYNLTKTQAEEKVLKLNLDNEVLNKNLENLSNREFIEIIEKLMI